MLKPSYAELMEVLNKDTEEASEITSRYTIVIAAAKRARQIIAGDTPMVDEKEGKPLSTAVEEIREGKIKVVPEGQGTVLKLKPEIDEELYLNPDKVKLENENNESLNEDEMDSLSDIADEIGEESFADEADDEDFSEVDYSENENKEE